MSGFRLTHRGVAAGLPEPEICYASLNPTLSTTETGVATPEELQQAAGAVNRGRCSGETRDPCRVSPTAHMEPLEVHRNGARRALIGCFLGATEHWSGGLA